MDITIVMCTRNRAAYLPQTLEKLKQLNAPGVEWELVFVDNGSSDNTAKILREFCECFEIPAQVIFEPRKGLSIARNAGWKVAQGKIICFTDDDCYPASNWLTMIRRALLDPEIGYVGGRVLLFDKNDAPITIQTSEDLKYFPRTSHIESGCIIGANFSCRKDMLERTDGFDQRLGAGTKICSGEDTDLIVRASLLGFVGLYDPSIVVYHHHRRKLNTEVKTLYSGYAYGRGALSMKTVIASKAKMLYLKNWYWRIRTLLLKGKIDQCFDEIRGALFFILVSRRKSN